MIDFNSWPSYVQLVLLAGPFVTGLSGLAHQAYITHRHYDRIASAFPNSRGLTFASSSFRWRCREVGAASGAVLFPKLGIRRDILDPEEIRNFPPDIKQQMLISITLLFVGAAWLMLTWGLLELSGVER
ncbi:hypothetical protein NNO07_21165 [Pseudomonas resinovorans]|uniref:Uncharacterized protein n=1 Tax=Metapseudomonas resinovorans TaxID=53412 RepID=A0ABT4Y9N7_METRE|nr:hypothetical protein [Pseudomonas resinovorans]MDA8485587.1 hypothetical protein [Pseudomonas resinovorans]